MALFLWYLILRSLDENAKADTTIIISYRLWQRRYGGDPAVLGRQIGASNRNVVLAAVGIYAVTAYAVAQRIPEIGLRMALGARTSQVVRLFVGQAMRPLALGVFVGLGGAFVAGRLLQSWLVKPAPVDPLTLVIVAVLIGLTAMFYPSWRGARVDPSTALRIE